MKDNSNLFIEQNDYISVLPHCMDNKNLTWTAKGIHAYLFSRANRPINFEDLKNRTTISMEEIKSAIKELIKHNYLYKITQLNDGIISKEGYVIFDTPKDKKHVFSILKNIEGSGWGIEEEVE